jgi:hypothetical protein
MHIDITRIDIVLAPQHFRGYITNFMGYCNYFIYHVVPEFLRLNWLQTPEDGAIAPKMFGH